MKSDVLLPITDATPYIKVGLSVNYLALIHVWCAVHTLCRVCPNAAKLLANMKKNFMKSSALTYSLQNENSYHILAPPSTPIFTCRRTPSYRKKHTESLKGKLNKACYIIRKAKQYISTHTLKMLYYAFFHSNITYSLIF
jgi:hypothetical protein